MNKAVKTLVLCAVAILASYVAVAATAQDYKILTTLQVGGEGGWDYLCADEASRRVYVSHSTEVLVYDMDKLNLVGRLEGFGFVHGIVVLPSGKKGFISDGKKNEVDVFTPSTLQITGRIKTDENPNSMVFNPTTNRLFVGHKPSRSLDVIDANTEQLIGKIQLHGIPEFPVTDQQFVYVNIDDKAEIARVNAKTLSVEQYWKMEGCERPSGLAIDTVRQRLFSTCRNGLVAVVNATNGTLLATVPSGQKPDAARFDPRLDLTYASNGDGTMTIIARRKDADYYVKQTLRTVPSARTMALDQKTHRAFLSAANLGEPDATGHAMPLTDTFRVLVVEPNH